MKAIIFTFALVSIGYAQVDTEPEPPANQITWPGWTITSSENTGKGNSHTSYPLVYLVDNNPQTAWVFSGRPDKWNADVRKETRSWWHGDYAVALEPVDTTRIDKLRIMNGYNKSAEVFAQNDRAKTIEIWTNDGEKSQLIKKTNLSDKMGWHDITIPAKKYNGLRIVFTDRFPGKVHDLCISEIELSYQGKRIDLKVPNLVVASEAGDCCCGSDERLLTRKGQRLPNYGFSELGSGTQYSPRGNYVAGLEFPNSDGQGWIWVYDVKTCKRVLWKKGPKDFQDFDWINDRELKLKGSTSMVVKVPKGK